MLTWLPACLPYLTPTHLTLFASVCADAYIAALYLQVLADKWDRPYTRDAAAYPAEWTRRSKFWPTVSRLNGVYGDRNLITKIPSHAGLNLELPKGAPTA